LQKVRNCKANLYNYFSINHLGNYPSQQLQEIINNQRLRAEAITAAQSILEKRKTQAAN
jgi:hypothetical protein